MTNIYKKSVLRPRTRVEFDPGNQQHMLDFARFLKYNNWSNGCGYFLEEPFADIPAMIAAKIAAHSVDRLMNKV